MLTALAGRKFMNANNLDNEIWYLRATAIELRRIAARVPEIGTELLSIAQQIETEANRPSRRGQSATP